MTQVICPKCGAKNEKNNRFCQKCGNSIGISCRNCGHYNQMGSQFCSSCGYDFSDTTFTLTDLDTRYFVREFEKAGYATYVSDKFRATLTSIGKPVESTEAIMFNMGISKKYLYERVVLSFRGNDDKINIFHDSDESSGYCVGTSKRLVVICHKTGIVSIYPHEYLRGVIQRRSPHETKNQIVLDFGLLGEVTLHTRIPELLKPHGLLSRMVFTNVQSAALDISTSTTNTVVAQNRKVAQSRIRLLIGFFQEISKINKTYTGKERGLVETKFYVEAQKKDMSDCFIATAALGTHHSESISVLRTFRDEHIKKHMFGNHIINLYERNSPPIAEVISRSDFMKRLVRNIIITPSVWLIRRFSTTP